MGRLVSWKRGLRAIRVRDVLVMGLLIREAFSFWTGHPFDFEIWVRMGYWVSHGYNPYSSLPFAPQVSFADDFGGPGSGFSPVIGYLPFWPVLVEGLYFAYALLGSPSPFVYYFFIKQTTIVADLLVAYFLYKYVKSRGSDKAPFVLKVWVFSPINIVVSALWGMFDAIAVLFVLLALMAPPGASRGFWSGVATFAKSVPLIYALPLARGPNPARNMALALGIPVAASLAIIWVAGWPVSIVGSTLGSTVVKNHPSMSLWASVYYMNTVGLISDSTLDVVAMGGGYVWIGAVAVATLLAYRWFGFDTDRGLVKSLLMITLAFLLLRGVVNEQYSLYLYFLAAIEVALWSPKRRNLLYAAIATVFIFNGTNCLLFIRYAAPLFPQALGVESGLIASIDPERNALLFLEAMAYGALNIYYLVSLYRERRVEGGRSEFAPAAIWPTAPSRP